MKKQRKKKLVALAMTGLMILSLIQNVSYIPIANTKDYEQVVVEEIATESDAVLEDAGAEMDDLSDAEAGASTEFVIQDVDVELYGVTEPAALSFMDIVYGFEITPGDTSTDPLAMGQSFSINMLFELPADAVLPLDSNYIYDFNLAQVAVEEDMTGDEIVGLIKAANTTTPLDIVMGNVVVGKYTIVDGLVTLNFYEGIETLMKDDTASRLGEFKFNCSLDESKMNDEGGDYILKFSTDTSIVNPTVSFDEKTTIDVDVDIEKTAGTFNAEDNTMEYTITLENTGTAPVEDVVVYDYMGNNLTFKSGTELIDNGASVEVDSIDPWSNDIKFTIPSLPTGTTTLTYTCDVSSSAITGADNASGSSNGLDNSIKATVEESDGDVKDIYIGDNSTSQSTSFSIYKDLAAKSVSVSDDASTVTWTVVINRGSTDIDLEGYVFDDVMDNDLTLIPDSVTVTCSNTTDPAANIAGLKDVITGARGDYEFLEGSKGEYTITYSATVPEHVGMDKYTNTATMSKDGYTDSAPATTPDIGSEISEKKYIGTGDDVNDKESIPGTDDNGNLILRWQTMVAVPSNSTKFVYTDYVQASTWENGLGFVEDSLVLTAVDGDGNNIPLVKGTDYMVEYSPNTPYDPDNMLTGTTYYMTVTFLDAGLDQIKSDGESVVTMVYDTIGRYADRTESDWQMYKNHYTVDVGSVTESGTAVVEKYYKSPGSSGDVVKSVASYDEKNHTVTWKITVDPGSEAIKNLELTDVVNDMKYYGYSVEDNNYTYDGSNMYVIVKDVKEWVWYQVEMTEVSVSGTDEHPIYTYAINFSDDMYIQELGTDWGKLDDANKNLISNKLEIYYTTQVTGEYLYYNNYGTQYTNKVTVNGVDELGASYEVGTSQITTALDTEVLSKNLITPDNGSTSVLEYTISVNKDGLNLNPSKDYFVVEDDLPENLVYMIDGTVVTDKDDNTYTYVSSAKTVEDAGKGAKIYHVSYENSVLKFTVPDEVGLNISYKVNMLTDPSNGSAQYVNTVKLEQPYVAISSQSSSNESRRVSSSSATISSILFKVEKISSQDVTNRLGGAVFTLKEMEYDNGNWDYNGVTYTATTEAGKLLNDANFISATGTHPKENRIYELSETTAPYGYEKTDQVYKFIILDDDSGDLLASLPEDVYPIMGGTTFVYANTPLTTLPANKLTIVKQYYQADGINPVQVMPANGAVIEIYDRLLNLEQCKSGSYTPLAKGDLGNEFTYTEVYDSNDPSVGHVITLEMIPDGSYTVYEKSAPEGYDLLERVYTFTVSEGKISWDSEAAVYEKAVTIDNKETYDNSITIKKNYYKASDTDNELDSYPDMAQFVCTNDATGEEMEIQNVSGSEGFEYLIEMLPAGTYTLDEKASDVYIKDATLPFKIVVDSQGSITITDSTGSERFTTVSLTSNDAEVTIDNVIKDNNITVNKRYYKADGTQITDTSWFNQAGDNQKVDFVLYKENNAGVYVEATASVYESYTDTTQGANYEDSYVWENLEPGNYKIEEKLRAGDNTKYEPVADTYFTVGDDYKITVTNGSSAAYETEVNVNNRLISGTAVRFYLTKEISNQLGDTTLADTSSGVSFEFVETTTSTPYTLNYNLEKKRWETDNLGNGTYCLTETQTKDGYITASKLTFDIVDGVVDMNTVKFTDASGNVTDGSEYVITVSKDGDIDTILVNLINKPYENSITINKTYNQPGGTDTVATPNPGAEFTLYSVDSVNSTETPIKTLSGIFSYKFDKLEPGEYVIKETTVPDGFAPCENVSFTVGVDYEIAIDSPTPGGTVSVNTDGDYNVSVTAKNILSNQFEITKEYTDLSGNLITAPDRGTLFGETTFALYEASNPNADISSAYMEKGSNVITLKDLKDGTYTLKETSAPDGFTAAADITLNVTNGKITASYAGTRTDFTDIYNNGTFEGSATLYNRQSGNELTINKTYLDAANNPLSPSQVANKASFRVINTATNAYVTNYTFNPNAGTYTFKNIPKGEYRIVETVPLGFEDIADATFEVDLNGAITFISTPSGWSVGSSDGTTDVDVSVENRMKANKLSLSKVYYDINGNIKTVAVSGDMLTMFTLVNSITGVEREMQYNSTTGVYEIENLMPGTYELVEEVPAGYLPVLGKITVTVALDATISASYTGGDSSDFLIVNSGTLTGASVEFKNHEVTNLLSITKSYVSATDKPLALDALEAEEYATFKLYQNVSSTNEVEVTNTEKIKVNKEAGVYTFANLDPGYYTIKETPGVGFEDESLVITFRVTDEKEIISVSGATATSSSNDFNKYFEIVNKREAFDNKLSLSKMFINQGGESVTGTEYDALLEDVEFAMFDANGDEVIDFAYDLNTNSWIVEHLEPGDYTIKETSCPDSYIAAGDIEVSVVMTAPTKTTISASYNGNIAGDMVVTQDSQNLAEISLDIANHQKVENYFGINKKYIDAFGDVITDESVIAELIEDTDFVIKAENSSAEAYIPYDATAKQFVLEDIQTGTYVISEIAPDGYIAISDIILTVASDGKITVTYQGEASDVVVTDSAIEVNKVTADVYNYNDKSSVNIGKYDIVTGEELPGALLTITDKDGNVIDTWTSTEGIHKVPIDKFEAGIEYTLTEITAPFGYEIAENIVFKLDMYGNVYIKTADGTFALADNNIVAMQDSHRYVNVSKVDITNYKELPGAKLIIKDASGNVIDQWTSTSEVHKVLMTLFKPDTEYTLTEITAPEGYEIAESIVFKLDAEGNVFVKADGEFRRVIDELIIMEDAPSSSTSEETDTPGDSSVQSGDNAPVEEAFVLMLMSLVGIVVFGRKRRRYNN